MPISVSIGSVARPQPKSADIGTRNMPIIGVTTIVLNVMAQIVAIDTLRCSVRELVITGSIVEDNLGTLGFSNG